MNCLVRFDVDAGIRALEDVANTVGRPGDFGAPQKFVGSQGNESYGRESGKEEGRDEPSTMEMIMRFHGLEVITGANYSRLMAACLRDLAAAR